MKNNYLSIDIGGTNTKYALFDNAGNLYENGTIATVTTNQEDFLKSLDNIIRKYESQIKGIAVSVPGKVDVNEGTVYYGGSLPFLDGLCLKAKIEHKYHIVTNVENDGKSAALAELWLGSLKEVRNGLILVLGTGVGGGIIINRHLYRGSHFQAGELSFMFNGAEEEAENYSQLVGYDVSAVSMIGDIATKIGLSNKKDGPEIFKAINAKNLDALEIFEEYCEKVARLIINVQAVIDVEKIAIGGGISAQPIVVKEIRRQYSNLLDRFTLHRETTTAPEIVVAHFQSNANLYGTLYAFLQHEDDF